MTIDKNTMVIQIEASFKPELSLEERAVMVLEKTMRSNFGVDEVYPVQIPLSCGCQYDIETSDGVMEKVCEHGRYFVRICEV